MKRNWLWGVICALGVGGCAASAPNQVAGGARLCTITEPAWAAAPRDFDRRTTLEAIAGLSSAAQADAAQLKAGQRGEVGTQLDDYVRKTQTDAFVSQGVAELGTRLRQLDCAVRRGSLSVDTANQLYAQILGELAAERGTLEPAGGSSHAVAP